ncbi:hypothetical protein JL721_1813 [Aureococcus anophagefferens]|nr:hypothetical protein JL721_1813 [Aureococcus anophagefferens]
MEQTELKHAPREMVFATQKTNGNARDGAATPASHLSINMGGQSLLLYDLNDPDNPLELAFQQRYGSIIGEELFSGRFHHKALYDIAYSPTLKYAAVAGDTGVKLVEMTHFKDLKRESIGLDATDGSIEKIEWSPDGHILTAATEGGGVHAFLARMPIVHNAHGTTVAYLSSLREITVIAAPPPPAATGPGGASSPPPDQPRPVVFPVGLEPSFVAVGPTHVAVGMNNVVMYYAYVDPKRPKVNEQEYLGKVDKICLNGAHAAVLSGTRAGTVEFFAVHPDEWTMLPGVELRHAHAVASLHPNAAGTRVVVVDAQHQGFIYNPVSAELTSIPSFPPSVQCVMWDTRDRNVLLVADGKELHTYVYAHTTIKGPMAAKLGPVDISADGEVTMIQKATPVQQGLYPICSREGTITCQVATGSITSITCPQYEHKEAGAPHQLVFCQNLALLRLKDAWNAALALKNRAYWLALSGKAMEIMDIDLAIRVYRQLGDAGMVMGLERIAHLEDKNLLAGHVLLLFSNYNAAQDLFLSSSKPSCALEMRRDLLHWDQALKLAHTLDPSQVPYISVAYAQQLEFKGEYETALRMFEAALRACDDRGDVGESKDGFGDGPPPTAAPGGALPASSADAARGMNQHSEAASLFELAEHFEKAAAIYIRKLNFTQAAAIMHKVALPKLHAQYAKACEAAGKLGDAVKAYEVAHDMDSVVRLYLGNLNQPERAFEIVRKTESSDGAQLVARFCQQQGDFRGAIEFLLMAKRSDEAFNLSKLHSQMDVYTAVLGDAIAPDDALSVAQHYEAVHELGLAGQFYALCGQYPRALKLFIQCGEKEVHRAIEIVGKARSDSLTHTLIDFLMGEPDGAAKTAVIIARQEQDLGSYKAAHAILYETTIQLEAQEVHVPQNLRKPFILLHSYLLVKKLIKAGDHDAAARMLLRVAKSISKFPSHGAPILTSTLMRPELRGKIDPKFKRKIEQMIRRPNLEEEPELLSPCPISGVMIPRTELECPTTKEEIPMCVVTGRHMEKDDWFEAVGVNRSLHAADPGGRRPGTFPDDAELEPGSLAAVIAGTFQRNPRHLVEFKPAIGVVFREYLEPYSHWAFGDLDVLMGDVEAFVDGDEWDDFDVVAYSFGDQWRAYTRASGRCTATPRTPAPYLRCTFLGPRLRKRLEDKAHYESCEGCYSTAVAAARLRTKFVVKHFTDAAQKGDRDAAWVTADGQNCLAGGDYGALDTIVLDGAGRYARSTLPRDPYARQDGGFAAAPFFHFQEWKKKWKSFSGHGHGGLPGALLATRYGVVPVPPLEPGARRGRRPPRALALEYCAFKACGDARPAFARDDLLWAYAGPGDGDLRAGDGPFAAHRAPEHRPALVVAASFLDDGAQDTLEAVEANGCGWTGPSCSPPPSRAARRRPAPRDLEEARRPRCFDGLLHRSIAAHDGAATFALVPGAFVAGLGEPAGDCGCQADADAPSKKQRDAVGRAAFLDRAARARADADAERRARGR